MVSIPQVTLPELSSYSLHQIEFLCSQSPAFSRYFELIKNSIDDLHGERHRAWLKMTAATVFQTASTAICCRYWSNTADSILTRAWATAELDKEAAALFALGKLGAQELNLSSDVDILVIAEARSQVVTEKKIRAFRKILTDASEFGFCFRLDFDLRPGGRSQTMAPTPAQFQEHYWSRGEAWEKMALVRLRPIAGSAEVRDAILEQAQRFSFRKFLDFTLLEDLKQVRARIHSEGFEERPGEIHLKLSRGGIRDIELFVNAMQVLHGGKISRLRTVSTEAGFSALKELKVVPPGEIDSLRGAYWHFRHWENLAQAVDDQQTHFIYWPCSWAEKGWPTLEEISREMKKVDAIVSSFLGPANSKAEPEIPPESEQAQWLAKLGFNSETVTEVWPSIMAASTLSQKTDRDERARRRFLHSMVTELSRSSTDKDLGLSLLLDFIRAIRAKASFFSVLNRDHRLIADIARLLSFSPYLGTLFAARPELLDSFVLNVDERFSPVFETALDEMAGRKFVTEVMASIRFLSDLDPAGLMEALTQTADVVTGELIRRLAEENGAQTMDLLCLGKWGGRELGMKSDLDFIFLCRNPPSEKDQKTARRFISRLTDPHRGGSLYDIDLRLRPSGKAGPILTTPENLNAFLTERAEIWERQAYLRARSLLAQSPIEPDSIWKRPIQKVDVEKLADIRRQLLKPTGVDLKFAAGGMVDVEFAAQTAILVHHLSDFPPTTLEMIRLLGQGPWNEASTTIEKNYSRLRMLEQLLTLSGSVKDSEFRDGQENARRCARFLQREEAELKQEIVELLKENATLLADLDPRQRF